MGAISCLIGGGESGGVAGFSGWFGGSERRPSVRSAGKTLGFGASGGLDLGLGGSLGGEDLEASGDRGGLGEEGGGD